MDRPATNEKARCGGEATAGNSFASPIEIKQRQNSYVTPGNQLFAETVSLFWPKPGTVTEKIAAALKRGESLTAGSSWQRFGWQIESRVVEVECADGRVAHVANYRLKSEPA